MKKKFFTLFAAAAMLCGGPVSSFADVVQSSVAYTANNDVALANGVKFLIKVGGKLKKVQDVLENGQPTGYVTSGGNATSVNDASVFEIVDYSYSPIYGTTFKLTVNGKIFALQASGLGISSNQLADAKVYFTSSQAQTLSAISGFKIAGTTQEFWSSAKAETKEAVYGAADLNGLISGTGFKFEFPDADPAPSVNPFSGKMVAVNYSGATYFAVANDASAKTLGGTTDEEFKASTFIAVSPDKTFGVTGLNVAGEGYEFTTVSGKNLAENNDVKKNLVAKVNAQFAVKEADQLNAPSLFTISLAKTKFVTKANENNEATNLLVGSYATGGVNSTSYVTTVSSAKASQIVLASTLGSNYVKATDILSDTISVFNVKIYAAPNDQTLSRQSRYYVNDDQKLDAAANLDLTAAATQWYISSVGSRGAVTLKNLANGNTLDLSLYNTELSNVYLSGDEYVAFIPVTAGERTVTLTDAQLMSKAEIVFDASPVLSAAYMSANNDVVEISDKSTANTAWSFEKAQTFALDKLSFAALKDGKQVTKELKPVKVQAYYIKSAGDKYVKDASNKLGLNQTEKCGFVIEKSATGKFYLHDFHADDTKRAYDINMRWTPKLDLVNNAINNTEGLYQTCTIKFEGLGKRLEAVSRHATFETELGSISLKENKGIVGGIISAQPTTFWLDTADSKSLEPKFYISTAIAKESEAKAEEPAVLRNFMYVPVDSMSYWDEDKAEVVSVKDYNMVDGGFKVIFRPAAVVAVDTVKTIQSGKTVLVSNKAKAGKCLAGLNRFKFDVTEADEAGSYYISWGANYVYSLNGVLGLKNDKQSALVVTLGEGDATSNESIEAESSVVVLGENGAITVQGAAGQTVSVRNILGQTLAQTVATSDNATIAVPAGIVVVTVGNETVKVVVK